MSIFYSSILNELSPYTPGEQPKDKRYVKLNTNECPYPPSPKALEAMRAAVNEDLRLYPDPEANALCQAIADHYGLSRCNVFVGNGSDEVLAFAFQAFFEPGKNIRFPEISYSFYPVYADLYRIGHEMTGLDDKMKVDVKQLCDSEGGVVFPNPNAPTGVALRLEEVAEILESNWGRVVIVDEAYVDFGAESAVGLLDRYPNLLVVQTFSKSRGLAGIRVGYALGSDELINGLNIVKNSFNSYTIDRISMAGAIASIKDNVYNIGIQKKIANTRDKTAKRLKDMGFTVTDSKANFLFVSPPGKKAEELYSRLREQGYLVRYFKSLSQWLRITVGTDEEMEGLLAAIERI